MTGSLPLLLNDGTNSYIYGPGGLPIEQINSESKVFYLHHDQQGSTRLMTGSTGKVEGTMTFDAYGNLTGSTGTTTTRLGYDGQYTSPDTGLIYLRARTYDPKTAQFLTVDPMVSQTHAPYYYGADSPINAADPTGKCGTGSLGAILESVNPASEENCLYQASKALVGALGGDASTIAFATALAAVAVAPFAPPLAVALGAVSAAAGAYASGQEAAKGEALSAALDALGAVTGGVSAGANLIAALDTWAAEDGGEAASSLLSSAKAYESLADTFDKLGYGPLAASMLKLLEAKEGCK